jgi:thioredoxin domain-containing protein 5
MWKLLVVSSILGLTLAEEKAPGAPSLDDKTFAAQVGASPHFVMFYAPWCGHCKRLAPTWEELAVKHAKDVDSEVTIAKVDCTTATALCSAQDVTGYPTLKFFKSGAEKEDGVKYRGNRDAASLEKFIAEKLGTEIPEEKPAATEDAAAAVENGLHVLTAASFASVVAKGDTLIKFYAPWCGHCQKLAPTWDELAKAFEKDEKVKVAKVDCTQHQAPCQEHEVRGYPTLHYFREGRKLETYKGARTLVELKDFVNTMKGEAAPAGAEDGKVPAVPAEKKPELAVVVLDKENFAEKTKVGVSFVKFFAPWCGHCKRLAPTWEELAQKYKDNAAVTIGHVDCTAADNANRALCDSNGVNGFPTLNIYKDGEKAEEYSGKRDLEALVAFVEKHLAVTEEVKKDEL